MIIAVNTIEKKQKYYLNFSLMVEFFFSENEEGVIKLNYTSTTSQTDHSNSYFYLRVTEEEKNRILNKLDLL